MVVAATALHLEMMAAVQAATVSGLSSSFSSAATATVAAVVDAAARICSPCGAQMLPRSLHMVLLCFTILLRIIKLYHSYKLYNRESEVRLWDRCQKFIH